MKNLGIIALTCFFTNVAMATTIGVSAHPFTMQKHVLSTEFSNYSSGGSGKGITARYLNRLNEQTSVDVGATITDGQRSNRIFAGADFLITPDYGRQPRFSTKVLLETMSTAGQRLNAFGAAPTLSKGFSFWGNEAFPFVALPVKVVLNTDERTYQTQTALAVGITGRVPLNGYQSLIANLETNISIRNSYSAIVLGISLPIQ